MPATITKYKNKNCSKHWFNKLIKAYLSKRNYLEKIGGQFFILQNKKMPPISEKRSPPMLKENTKEHISNGLCEKLTNRVPEILDFRESWLQEIEMYKDQIRVQQQLLTQHNHVHTSEGCQIEIPRENNRTLETIKRRTISDSDPYDINKTRTSIDSEDERAREDNYAPIYNNNSQNHHHINNNHPPHQYALLFNGKTQMPSSQIPKVIANPYHNSLLNNTTTSENEKTKVFAPVNPVLSSSMPVKQLNGINSSKKPQNLNVLTSTTINTRIDVDETIKNEKPLDKLEIKSNGLEILTNGLDKLKSVDDDSNLEDDDEEFGDIDEGDLNDDSSDSEDEYKGYEYLINNDHLNNESDDIQSSGISLASTPASPFTPSLFSFVPPFLTFSSHIEKGPTIPQEIQKHLKWKLTAVMPKVVRRVVGNSGFRLIKKTNDWMGTWEKHMKSPGFKTIRSYQKFNHIPGSFKIGRKDSVWRNIRSFITKYGKQEFGFMQRTFIMPQDLEMFRKAWPKFAKQNTKWIIKPPASARGTGIKVVSRWSQIPKLKPLIVQKYIERPLLINGSKFDLRLYVVVTSINPLRVFMHTDGLARFASVQYSDKLDTLNDRCMHLTNYSINKLSENYAKNEDINACQGHKWTLKSLWSYFQERGINTKRLWGTLRNVVVRTLLSGESGLNKMFKTNVNWKYNCYELFGFDVLLDENLIPWLLEVNISPSLHSELPLDLHVKGPLVQAVLNTAMYQIPPRLTEEQEKIFIAEYNLKSPLCYDKRLYVTHLSPEETKKHNRFTHKSIEYREEYLESILEDLTPDDVRCLIIAEDELARCSPLERIFPGPNSYKFLQYIDYPRYYNRLIDAWETRYANKREEGIKYLQKLCEKGFHLIVPPMAKESVERETTPAEDQDPVDQETTSQKTGPVIEESVTVTTTSPVSERLIQDNNLTTVSQTCSKQVAIPQKQLNSAVYNGPRPIAVEIN